MSKCVLLGFSGGIDSTAAVEILQREGYRVVGLTLDTTGDTALIENARRKADQLGIDLIIDNVREQFEQQIVDYFVETYMNGATPAPCTVCNPQIKWRRLDEVSQQMGIEYIATGHYFRITECNGKRYVSSAADPIKDQSYYLWGLSQQLLKRIVTPMGNKIKAEVKQNMGLSGTARESMGVCFLAGRNYGELIRQRRGQEIGSGQIVDKNGCVVGRHDGFPYYTIGQKRGLEIFGDQHNYCITNIDATTNRLIVGTDSDLYHNNLIITDYNVVDMDEILHATDINVKIRGFGRNPDGLARVSLTDNKLHATLDQPAWAAAKAQPVVFYRGERVVGGGFLEKYF